jgi:hypothetical protein
MDNTGNLFASEIETKQIAELARFYVSSGTANELNSGGSDSMPPVEPITANLTGNAAPVSDQPWLTIGNIVNGVINFSFTPNTAGTPRTAHITVPGINTNPDMPSIQYTVTQGQVLVPNVVGQTQVAATTALTSAGLIAGTVTTGTSLTVPSGSVIGTSPAAGAQVNFGSAVNLVISTGLPPAPAVTSQFKITLGAPVLNRTTNRFTQAITIVNSGAALTAAAFVLDNLAAGYALYQPSGLTSATVPAGSPYQELGAINAGASITFSIQLTRTGTPTLTYTPRILGVGLR